MSPKELSAPSTPLLPIPTPSDPSSSPKQCSTGLTLARASEGWSPGRRKITSDHLDYHRQGQGEGEYAKTSRSRGVVSLVPLWLTVVHPSQSLPCPNPYCLSHVFVIVPTSF